MFDIGAWEIMVIGVMALVILGPERLPGAIKSTISTVRSIKQMANGFKQEVVSQLDVHELHENLKKAEALGMENIGNDLQKSVDELKAAAASVQEPYKKSSPNPEFTGSTKTGTAEANNHAQIGNDDSSKIENDRDDKHRDDKQASEKEPDTTDYSNNEKSSPVQKINNELNENNAVEGTTAEPASLQAEQPSQADLFAQGDLLTERDTINSEIEQTQSSDADGSSNQNSTRRPINE